MSGWRSSCRRHVEDVSGLAHLMPEWKIYWFIHILCDSGEVPVSSQGEFGIQHSGDDGQRRMTSNWWAGADEDLAFEVEMWIHTAV